MRKKSKETKGFISENFKVSLKYLRETKNYIWTAFFLFLIFGLIGFLFPIFFEEQILDLIKELIAQTEGLGTFGLTKFIFLNNIKSSFFSMALGIFLGIFSFLILIVNGYVLGFVASKSVAVEGILVLWRLLPHGIFEIPAVMISAGLGLKLGAYLFVKHKKGDFKQWLLNSLRVFLFIVVPLLIIAAIIEGILIIFLS